VPVVCPNPGPCAQATCDPEAGCVVEPLGDGAVCDGGDPCLPGTCQQGTCVLPAGNETRGRSGHFLAVSRFVLRAVGRSQRMVAEASFGASDPIDPTQSGGVLEVSAPDGTILYRTVVPPAAFRANRSRRVFKYVPPRSAGLAAGMNGLKKLVLRTDGTGADVTVSGASPDLARAAAEPTIGWAMHFGGACARDLGLSCSAEASGVTRCN